MADDGELTVELAVEPEVGMELCLEKLKMLRYERDFLTSRRPPWPPCTRTHFAVPTPGRTPTSSSITHLALRAPADAVRTQVQTPDQFDDPNATCAAIFAELKARLRHPLVRAGEAAARSRPRVRRGLERLVRSAMARHYQHGLSRPVYPRAGDAEGEGAEGGMPS